MQAQQLHQSAGPGPAAPGGPAAGAVVGIEIGGTKLQIVAGDPNDPAGPVASLWRGDVRPADGGPGIQHQLLDALDGVRATTRIAAIGVGFGGPIDWRSGRIARSHQIDGWEGFDLVDWLSHAAGAPVAADNDANVGALGEATRGAGAGHDPVFYVTLGSGVGGGLVSRGDVYHGAPPGEAEFGHLLLDRDGTTVESRCSGWAVDARVRAVGQRLRQSTPRGPLANALAAAGPATGGEARHVGPALAAGDPEARRIVDDVAADLAFALSHPVHLAHPQVIVLGGGLAQVGEPLRAAVERELPRYVMRAFHPCPAVKLAALGEDSVPVGAVELARRLVARA